MSRQEVYDQALRYAAFLVAAYGYTPAQAVTLAAAWWYPTTRSL